jgi:probable addiction module antidote protein
LRPSPGNFATGCRNFATNSAPARDRYLSAAAEDEDPNVLLGALANAAKARGMAQVAKAAGLGRESLYKALAPGSHPRFETIAAVCRALGVKVEFVRGQAPAKAASKRVTIESFRPIKAKPARLSAKSQIDSPQQGRSQAACQAQAPRRAEAGGKAPCRQTEGSPLNDQIRRRVTRVADPPARRRLNFWGSLRLNLKRLVVEPF